MVEEFYKAFLRIQGIPILIIGFVVTFSLWSFDPNETIPLKWAIPILLLLALLILTSFECARFLHRERGNVFPHVIEVRSPAGINNSCIALLLINRSPLFSHETIVTIYIKDNNFELPSGYGFVESVQAQGLIQVVVTDSITNDKELWNRLSHNDREVLKSIIVKPSITKSFVNGGYNV